MEPHAEYVDAVIELQAGETEEGVEAHRALAPPLLQVRAEVPDDAAKVRQCQAVLLVQAREEEIEQLPEGFPVGQSSASAAAQVTVV